MVAKRIVIVPWVFNRVAWAEAIERATADIGKSDLAAMLGVSNAALWHWTEVSEETEFPHPAMHNFLKVCNLLDLDARDFFILGVE